MCHRCIQEPNSPSVLHYRLYQIQIRIASNLKSKVFCRDKFLTISFLGSLCSIKWLWEWWYLWSKVTTDHSPRWLLDIYTASSLTTSQYTPQSALLRSATILHLHCKLPCLDSIYGLVWISGQIPTLNSNHLHFQQLKKTDTTLKQQYFRGSIFPNWHILKQCSSNGLQWYVLSLLECCQSSDKWDYWPVKWQLKIDIDWQMMKAGSTNVLELNRT